ncbi:diguanylate cyclase (GGDEF) domain-containing protein [Arthrobacter sp. ok909]|uniref:putative bifunctional diguanylate cyclase/phosphodiesterase n=1 Tax=Arthrobacter sp. ok909 TaxID=1761746 RepID=UPI000885CD45|nr:EAL domain-containing protein [Arthrobacter sp. ok909]SDO90356.1 diguanylate cyclase (GGDEF) domain-containing protein [Arthrobacter sp. ok909]
MSYSNSKLADPALASPSSAAATTPGPSGGAAEPATGGAGRRTRRRRPARPGSLKREWSRAFMLMLLALLAGAAATVVGVHVVTDQIQRAAAQHRVESEAIAELRADLDAHEQAGLQLLSSAPVETSAFLQQQEDISARFDAASVMLPDEHGMRSTVREARASWQEGLSAHGLWGSQVAVLHGNHVAEVPAFAASGATARALLADIRRASLDALDDGVAYGAQLQQMVVAGRTALFALAAVGVFYFRRRMTKYLMRPIEGLYRGVLKLQAGDYSHRISVVRNDELGQLAEAFNSMAATVHDSHLELTFRATHDPLTGLANRAVVAERLAAAFSPDVKNADSKNADARNVHTDNARTGHGGRHEGLLIIDVDDFKDVNDSLGHEGGDALLIQLAQRLRGCVRGHDLVARLGGDEFAIVVLDDAGTATDDVAGRIQDALREPFSIDEVRLKVTVSMGAAQRTAATADPAELMRQADFAMYMAKHGGKGRYQLFDARGYDEMTYRAALRSDLATAVLAGQLRLDYQPVVDLRTGGIVGVEALVRWEHPTLGRLSPADFIPLAEETGEIGPIGCWVLDTATRHVAGWRRSPGTPADIWVSVNLSTLQLSSDRNLAALERILSQPAAQADKVILEVTESALATSADGGVGALNRLKSFGVRIAIDDFGTGFSSLSTLAVLPADILKIDRSFLSRLPGDAPAAAMLEGILEVARKLNLAVIAEGIEDTGQLGLLRSLGCDMGQGFLLASPSPSPVLEALLSSGSRLQPPAGTAASAEDF